MRLHCFCIKNFPKPFRNALRIMILFRYKIQNQWGYIKLCLHSLTYNAHMNGSYAADVFIEPAVWLVDNYAHLLGPVCEKKTIYKMKHLTLSVGLGGRCVSSDWFHCLYCLLAGTTILVGKESCHDSVIIYCRKLAFNKCDFSLLHGGTN